ncbi:MAG: DUF2969 domain-containing protein [Lactobacillaceae bacterium]|jgi:hypothetical protein|nr:DUF2969 domain-containing protein [Lactobacillaceae bacterium]
MASRNKAINVEINDLGNQLSEVKINKVRLGTIDETVAPLKVIYGDKRVSHAKTFDEAVELLIAEYNLHH